MHMLFAFDYKTQKHLLFSLYVFSHEKKTKHLLFVMTL
jgi:hypothetical protein